MLIQSDNTQKVPFSLTPRTAPTPSAPNGLPARLDGPVRVEVLTGPMTFVVNPDGLSGEVISGDAPQSTSTFQFVGDADLAEGIKEIRSEVHTYEVTEAQAASFGEGFGAPVAK
ncbi:MAG TPA: hypothetical protein VJ826_15385 [Candidatus Polarisedimenticolaceae bacterium]|nr:hypothetical protein [Candidatus Polarisedimenticolaceae bacterium]